MPGVAPDNVDFVVSSPYGGTLFWQNNDEYQYIEIWENKDGEGYALKYTIAGHKESHSIGGLEPATSYCYKVRGGWWEPPGETDFSAPEDCETTYALLQAPTDIETTVFSDFIEIIFKDKSSAEDVFCIYRNVNGGGWPAQASPTYTVAANMEYYRDTAITPGNTYQYRVAARENPSNYSAYGTGTQVTAYSAPNVPTGATISEVTDEEMRFSWTAPAAGDPVVGYKIQIDDNVAFPTPTEYIVAADVLDFLFKGLTPGQQYWIKVCSYNGVGDSAFTAAENDTALAQYVRSDFEVFVRDPNIKPIYIAEIDLKMDLLGFPLMSDDDLVGCWPFDETSGMVAHDKSKQGNNGSLENMEEGDHVDGKVNKALNFDGVDEYVNCGNDASLNFGNGVSDKPFTIAMWVNLTVSDAFRYISKANEFSIRNSNYWRVQLKDLSTGGFLQRAFFDPVAHEGSWAFFVVTYDGSGVYTGIKAYFNGEEKPGNNENSGTYVAMENTGSNVEIAKEGGIYGNGLIDEVRIYKRVLTLTEIKALYDTPGHRIHEIPITERGMTIDHAWEDGEAYTVKASKAQVQANASTFYHDTANRKLYIHTSAEDNPYNFFVEAGFTHLIPSRDFDYVDTVGCTLPPWLSADSIPGVTQEIKSYCEGSTRLSTGSISFKNTLSAGAYYFDKRFETFTWIGARLALYCGKETFSTLSKFKKMFSAYISDKEIENDKISFSLRDARKELDRNLVLNKYWVTDYPGLEEDFVGREKPKAFGFVEGLAPVPIERYDASENKSTKVSYHDGRSKSVGKVMLNEVEKTKDTHYYCDLQRSIITFDKSLDVGPEDIILVSFTGEVNDADEPVENGAEVFKWLLNNEAGIPTTRLNTDWIYETKYANTKSESILFYKDTPYEEILKTIEHTTEAYIIQDEEARIGLRPLQTTVPSKAKYIWDFQSKGHKHHKERESLYRKVKVYYGEDTQSQEWETKEATNNEMRWKHRVEKELPIYTYYRDPSNAQALATTILGLLNKPYIEDELPAILFDVFPGDLIPFSRTRFFDASGTADEVSLRVLRIEKNPQQGTTKVKMVKV